MTPDPSDPQSSEHGLHAMLIVGYNDRQEALGARGTMPTSTSQVFSFNRLRYVLLEHHISHIFSLCV